MSELYLKLLGLALVSLVLIVILRKMSADGALWLKLVTLISVSGVCFIMAEPIVELIYEISGIEGFDRGEEWISILLRVLCIAALTHICSSFCKDSGEASLASYVEMGGKAEIILLCLPLIKDLIEMAGILLEMS